MEKRKFPRMNVDLSIRYRFRLLNSKEDSTGTCFLKDISSGGMFFRCASPLALKDGNIGDFTIETTPIRGFTSRFTALGKVVRLGSPGENQGDFGVAVQFLSNLSVELG